MARPGWTAEVMVDADLDKVPDGPIEAAKYAIDQVRRLSSPIVKVERDDGQFVESWIVDTGDGEVTYIGRTRGSDPDYEDMVIEQPFDSPQAHPILPGALVERIGYDLDPREVVAIGRDWLTLDILGEETERLPMDNYRVVAPADGAL